MITSAIINFFVSFASLLVNILPSVSENSNLSNAITTASTYVSATYNIFPYIVTAILAILSFDLIFEGSYLAFKAVYWVIRRLPTQS